MTSLPKKAIEAREKFADVDYNETFGGQEFREIFKDGFDAGYTYRDAEVAELVAALEKYARFEIGAKAQGAIFSPKEMDWQWKDFFDVTSNPAKDAIAKWKAGRE